MLVITKKYQNLSIDEKNAVVLDIETTGLSAGNSMIYLIGTAYNTDNGITVRQWFADNPGDEYELLGALFAWLSDYDTLITYNGDSFDLPFLRKKAKQLHLDCPIEQKRSIDALKEIKAAAKLLRLENYQQKSVEHFLGIPRKDRLSGSELIALYKAYVISLDNTQMELLLLHNLEDILGLIKLLPLRNCRQLARGEVSYVRTEHASDSITFILQMPKAIPCSLSCGNEHFLLECNSSTAQLHSQLYQTELKYFYPNYRDYYYLPAEDCAIHKSVAQYVDKSYRQQAKVSNCYSKKNGIFLPQYKEIITPAFRENAGDRLSYFDAENGLPDIVAINRYIEHILQTLL